jgi:hypothetical protein
VRRRLIRRPHPTAESPPSGEAGDAATGPPPAARIRRDRRGRGLRGPLAPPESPLSRTRAEAFHDLVEDAVERLEVRWRRELAAVEFAIAQVPGAGAVPEGTALSPSGVPLSRLHPGGAGRNARIVLYRRPIEARAKSRADLAILVQDLITEQVAELLGVSPETIDPDYGLD